MIKPVDLHSAQSSLSLLSVIGLGASGLEIRVWGSSFLPLLSAVTTYAIQRAHYPLIKEHTLNHNLRAPIIKGIFLN